MTSEQINKMAADALARLLAGINRQVAQQMRRMRESWRAAV